MSKNQIEDEPVEEFEDPDAEVELEIDGEPEPEADDEGEDGDVEIVYEDTEDESDAAEDTSPEGQAAPDAAGAEDDELVGWWTAPAAEQKYTPPAPAFDEDRIVSKVTGEVSKALRTTAWGEEIDPEERRLSDEAAHFRRAAKKAKEDEGDVVEAMLCIREAERREEKLEAHRQRVAAAAEEARKKAEEEEEKSRPIKYGAQMASVRIQSIQNLGIGHDAGLCAAFHGLFDAALADKSPARQANAQQTLNRIMSEDTPKEKKLSLLRGLQAQMFGKGGTAPGKSAVPRTSAGVKQGGMATGVGNGGKRVVKIPASYREFWGDTFTPEQLAQQMKDPDFREATAEAVANLKGKGKD